MKLDTLLPNNLAIPLPGTWPREKKTRVYKKSCPKMYMQLVLVFYHCVTNYQNLSSFKYLPIIISQFHRMEVWVTHVWFSWCFTKLKPRSWPRYFTFWGIWEWLRLVIGKVVISMHILEWYWTVSSMYLCEPFLKSR